jgi:hypothetical protein
MSAHRAGEVRLALLDLAQFVKIRAWPGTIAARQISLLPVEFAGSVGLGRRYSGLEFGVRLCHLGALLGELVPLFEPYHPLDAKLIEALGAHGSSGAEMGETEAVRNGHPVTRVKAQEPPKKQSHYSAGLSGAAQQFALQSKHARARRKAKKRMEPA